jgi:mono/diheme cytochrome c family protein
MWDGVMKALVLSISIISVAGLQPVAAQQTTPSLPKGVTAAMVEKGKQLFEGQGLCAACHGFDGKGAVGPDLTDTVWVHNKGSFEEIAAQIIRGIPESESKSGNIMPPRGGSTLSDEELRAVAAYVWSLSHGGK